MITVKATPMMAIRLGRLGENERLRVAFDVSALQTELPGASFTIINQGPGDATAYPCPGVTVEGGTLYWPITSAELKQTGRGRCELIVTVGDVVAKSVIYGTEILEALDGSGEAPEPWDSWQIEFAGMVADAQEAAAAAAESVEHYPRIEDGVWMVWDAQSGDFVSTGVEATGPKGDPGTPGSPGAKGDPGQPGQPGEDGVSPTATVTQTATGATITVTDAEGTTTAEITNGKDGDPGAPGDPGTPGISPTVTVTDITGGHRITITDADGAHSFDVMDGDVADAPVQSVNGQTGAVVLDAQDVGAYEKPVTGIPKTDLENAVQISLGKADTALQSAPVTSVNTKTGAVVLTPSDIGAGTYSKPSGGIPASDLAAGVIPTVPVQDVQVNGASILNQGVANIPKATDSVLGVFKVSSGLGISSAGSLYVDKSSSSLVKAGENDYKPIVPSNQHQSTFYGLAKAAGSDEKDSTLPLGQYTYAAKVAIQKMLGIYEAPWELIREDTVTNATEADIEITADGNGQAFELTDVYMQVWMPQQETQASIGDYGTVRFYYNNSNYITSQMGTWTQAASASERFGQVLLTNENGAIKNIVTNNATKYSSVNLVGRTNVIDNDALMKIGTFSFTKSVIKKVTGTLKYKLYGRRKWN